MNIEKLQNNYLFLNFNEADIHTFIAQHQFQHFLPGEVIVQQGEAVSCLYVILSGKIEVYSYDLSGNKKMVAIFEDGDIFGESLALSADQTSPFFIASLTKTSVMIMTDKEIESMDFSSPFLQNLLRILATKNQFLTHKIECINKGTIEERVYEVLQYYYLREKTYQLTLPYNKTQLAEYLCVNRSALSRKISEMEKQGVFQNKKNTYNLNPSYFKEVIEKDE